jgi:5-oxoprolinase (ATP-hydrolysing)
VTSLTPTTPTLSEPLAKPLRQFWCDVGGTFTDAFLVDDDGRRRSTKVLSSGIVKGMVEHWIDDQLFVDRQRSSETDDFWVGSTIHLLDENGTRVSSFRCVAQESSTGRVQLGPLGDAVSLDSTPSANVAYEIESGLEAPVVAARLLTQTALRNKLPPLSVRLGTTRGTNALLTRQGSKVAFLTTKGFGDLLAIGYQDRPQLFTLAVKKRKPLYETVIEIDERLSASGEILQAVDPDRVRQQLEELKRLGIQALAISFLHGYQFSQHEALVEKLAREAGFNSISRGSQVASMIKVVSRSETTVVDAYLGPVVRAYLKDVAEQFGIADAAINEITSGAYGSLKVMTSAGGLVDYRLYLGKDSVLSGPAGGVVALTQFSQASGVKKIIGLDMGGTSTDVCRIDGVPAIEYESIKADIRLMTPMLAIHTVAAGGGSICRFDGVQWLVGPQSAGSNPGPACYGRGGPLTVTDLNLILGRIVPEGFPFSLNRSAAIQRLDEILVQAKLPVDDEHRFRIAAGFRRIANEHMAAAARKISIAQGADPRQHALLGFGGAAGQHLCEIADILQQSQIVDLPDSGLLSALGMGFANLSRWNAKPFYRRTNELTLDEVGAEFRKLEELGREQLASENASRHELGFHSWFELRYAKTDQSLLLESLEDETMQALEERFHRLHQRRFGYRRDSLAIEVVAIRTETIAESLSRWPKVESSPTSNEARLSHEASPPASNDQAYRSTRFYSTGGWCEGWLKRRHQLQPNATIDGPGIVLSDGHTTVVDRGWNVQVLSDRTLFIRQSTKPTAVISRQEDLTFDPVLREILAQRIASIADSMGIVLEQTAMSVNIKERRDFSCAVFSNQGDLIANAQHVPVHLGAMSDTVKAMIARFSPMQAGDCFITNDPYQGGSHLPDVTVITPVFGKDDALLFFTANRAHHAEIGGLAPGSMSPLTKSLEEEGVILPAMYLVRGGQDQSDSIRLRLAQARYPSRAMTENMADIAAQQAANQRGDAMLRDLVEEYGWPVIENYLHRILEASEIKVRHWIQRYQGRTLAFADKLDDGTPLVVKLDFLDDRLVIDFEGTGAVSRGNFNANPAIVTAAVLYVIRTQIADDLPLNSGALRPVEIRIPVGLLSPLQPDQPLEKQPAVAAGNVETSQRIVDCLLGALRVAGASQGTMNNWLMGNERFGYYETLGGGTGATDSASGADAVQSHMTNTRLTDPEILEVRYPVRLTKFEIRKGSSGQGRHSGGEGLHREMQLLETLDVSFVTGRRHPYQPYGANGGGPGASGENYRVDHDGCLHPLPAVCQIRVEAGESIGMKTPGGGGYGSQVS